MKALSFATDILPILMQDSSGAGCGLAVACHGNPPVYLDSAMTHAESFVGTPATVKAVLLGSSVNAPSMKLVAPGSVGTSFLAYKLSGKPGLTCIQSACKAHNSIGTITTCGDPMPYVGLGMLADADRTKILDWIAQGAKD